jgi:prepilin-type processing-associated H-X9-DG protein
MINQTVNWHDAPNEPVVMTPLSIARCPTRGGILEPVNANGPGGTTGGFGKHPDSDLRTHYVAILGAHTWKDGDYNPPPALPYFCSDKSSVYTMELGGSTGMGSGGGQSCLNDNNDGNGRSANNGIFVRHRQNEKNFVSTKTVTDGTSNTFMIGESAFGPIDEDTNMRPWAVGLVGEWAYNARNITFPINAAHSRSSLDPQRTDVSCGSEHSSGTHFGFADGSVHFLNDDIDLRTLYFLASRAGDEVIAADVFN